jgi:hypothetical protein
VFADNLRDHNINVMKWRAAERAKGNPTPLVADDPPATPTTAGEPAPTKPKTKPLVQKVPPVKKDKEGAAPAKAKEKEKASGEVLPWAKAK